MAARPRAATRQRTVNGRLQQAILPAPPPASEVNGMRVAVRYLGADRAVQVGGDWYLTTALPGSNPICKQRIVTPIAVDLTPTDGGVLTLRIDPRGMFPTVDFSTLTGTQIPDTSAGAGAALFKGLLSNAGVYQLTSSEGVKP